MPSKFTLEDIVESLRAAQITPQIITQVVRDLNEAAKAQAEDKEGEPKAPKVKLQTVVIAPPDIEGVAHVLQMDPDAPVAAVIDRIRDAARAFNQSRKGRRHPVRSLQETLEVVRGVKYWKDEAHPERKTKVLTREPVQVVQAPARDQAFPG